MNEWLFRSADFLSRPPGFYVVLVALVVCTALVPLGMTDLVTYVLSVAAIVITGVVLIQGYRDTAAIHAKLDEIIIALGETRNDVVGLEHADPKEIQAVVERLEQEAELAGAINGSRRLAIPGSDNDTDATSTKPALTPAIGGLQLFHGHTSRPDDR